MTTRTEARLLTADDLLRLYSEGVRGELIRGVLCETMSTGELHGKIVANLVIEIGIFIRPRGLGTLLASDAGVLVERDPDSVREPDIAFTSVERRPLDAWNEKYAEIVPDLVVEVASPRDGRSVVHDKAMMWLRYGVRLVWVAHPRTRTVDVHRAGHEVVTLSDGDALDGLDVLPGFHCDVSSVFGPRAATVTTADE